MKPAALASMLDDMIRETKKGHLNWLLEMQSTDELDASVKQILQEDGKDWTVDECFVSFSCRFRGKDQLFITYEHIKQCNGQMRSENLLFMPPMDVRFFDVGILSPYIVDGNAVIFDKFHQLWELLMQLRKSGDPHVSLKIFDPYE